MSETVPAGHRTVHEHEGTAGHHSHNEKLHDTLHHLKADLVHFKHKLGKFGNIINPNHRHDEKHEQEVDKKRTEIAHQHRFESFAPRRTGNQVKFYVDGRDYFWALSLGLESAKECIYIADWWISPELFLRRPPSYNAEDRFDTILKRRAEAGVKIYVIVYKEVSQALTCDSLHTKHALEGLCPKGSPGHGNIRVMRHPDHNIFENAGDMTFYWAHHEKFCVIDHELAFIGGLDICFGRWDVKQHPLADVHPGDIKDELWPGQDYNNNRIMDFQNVENWKQNQLSKEDYGRMPWHDVSIGLRGECVLDMAEHFVGRWNFVKRDKYKRNKDYDWLQLTWVEDQLIGAQHPHFPVGDYVKHPMHDISREELRQRGSCPAQLVRSSADWSHGILTEHSIQNAYHELIANAQHYVYIENQFFITATGEQQKPIINTIGAAIVEAIVKAHNEHRKFRVVVLIPSIPGFAGDLRDKAANGTRAIMDYQYKSMFRGEHSIAGRLHAQGINPDDYISYYSLRTYDRLNRTERIIQKEEKTGVKYEDVQHAQAQEIMGEAGATGGKGYDSSSEESDLENDHTNKREARRLKADKAKFEKEEAEYAPHDRAKGKPSVAKDALQDGQKVSEEPFEGNEEIERQNFITEQCYIHAKVLIVDDKYALVGSSNLNDRSQLGFHDSEMTIVIEDDNNVDTTMNGKPYKASHLPAQLRRQLWREHLGLMPHQEIDATDDPNAMPPGQGDNELHEDEHSRIVDDPLSDELWNMWKKQAHDNTVIFRELFHCVPDDAVKTFKDYDEFLPREGIKSGHLVDPNVPIMEVKKRLDGVRGHLVEFPMQFLINETMAERGLDLNQMTESIYT